MKLYYIPLFFTKFSQSLYKAFSSYNCLKTHITFQPTLALTRVPTHPPSSSEGLFKKIKEEMTEKLYLDEGIIPEEVRTEISFLHSIGVEIEELEHLIRIKLSQNFEAS